MRLPAFRFFGRTGSQVFLDIYIFRKIRNINTDKYMEGIHREHK